MSRDDAKTAVEENKPKSKFMKLQEGENKFRILTSPIVGWEDWDTDAEGKKFPIRYRQDEKPADEMVKSKDGLKSFWAMVVWNYADSAINILQITQVSVQKAILALHQDIDWGDPTSYDLKVTKSGKGLDTEYAVLPVNKGEISEAIAQEKINTPVNLEALYDGKDPYA